MNEGSYMVMGRSGPIGRGLTLEQAERLAEVSGCLVCDSDDILESIRSAVTDEVLAACDRLQINDATARATLATRAMVGAEAGLRGRLTDQQRREHRADAARLLGWARGTRFTLPDDGPGDYEHRRAVAGRYRHIARGHLAVLRADRSTG